jgi:diguanylate cyclase (GGDEF)-like protein
MLAAATTSQAPVQTGFLEIDGRSMLVGVGYLEQLGWYNVTVMDVDAIIDRSLFLPLAILLGLVVLAAALLVTLLFKRTVLDRLAKAERAVARVEAGDFSIVDTDEGRDEIGRLARALSRMASAVHDHTATLENAVRERTQQLQEIADRDALTGILNRRGFTGAMSERLRRAASEDVGFGLIVLDIDRFKAINDGRGHVAGDAVIREVARRLQSVLDANDVCGRWGGDEFILLLGDCDAKRLAEMAEKILSVLRGKPVALPGRARVRLTGSAGGHLLTGADDLDTAVHRADMALYAAKRAGRNRWVAYEAVRHLDTSRDRHVA